MAMKSVRNGGTTMEVVLRDSDLQQLQAVQDKFARFQEQMNQRRCVAVPRGSVARLPKICAQ